MKAARLYGPRQLQIDEVPAPRAGQGQVLVRVGAVGLCGSDVHYYCDGHIGPSVASEPLVLGHEFAGTVEAIGPGVEGLHEGQSVAVDPAIPCGVCELCVEGHPNICPTVRFAGTPPTDGALRELLAWPARHVIPLPVGMSLAVGAALETLGVCLHAINLGHVRLADRVAILGAGPIGLLLVRLARLSGAVEVFVTDSNPSRLPAARVMGADATIDVDQDDPVAAILRLTGGRGVDVTLFATADSVTRARLVSVAPRGYSEDSSLDAKVFECLHIAILEIYLDESAQRQFDFRCSRDRVNRLLFFDRRTFFDIRFPIVTDFRFLITLGVELGRKRRPLFQAADFGFEFGIAFLQLLDRALKFLESLGIWRCLRAKRLQRQ